MSDTGNRESRLAFQAKPEVVGNELIYSYTATNNGPGDIYVSEAFHEVDRATRAAFANRNGVVIALQPDGFALILRGLPPMPPFPVTRPVIPLMHRLRAGERVDRRVAIPLPLAETSPYQPYGNIRDYVMRPIEGVVLALDWIAAEAEGLVATPAAGAEDLFALHAANLRRDMRRASAPFPAKGLSILQRVPKP